MGEALYRKHRPKKLSEVVGQPHITKTLQNALKEGKVSHGYLFSGPRGVGKTSIARILAHEINGFDYADSRGSLDIIEIDAASNRRIDEIREIRDKIHTSPVTGKYKVYIIDEVHMLTREAFNALLKTLEEPPAHVIFILATTEAHKVPDTIASRTQRFAFKPIARNDVTNHLKQLAKLEKISVSDEALELIAEHGGGSFRDSISLLDQLAASGTVDERSVHTVLGMPSSESVVGLIEAIKTGNLQQLISNLKDTEDTGYTADHIAHSLLTYVRNKLLEGVKLFGKETVLFMEKLLQIPAARDQGALLELVLVDFCLKYEPSSSPEGKPSKTTHNSEIITASPPKKASAKPQTDKPKPNKSQLEKKKSTVAARPLSKESWETVLANLKQTNNTLYGIARMARPEVNDDEVILKVPFKFHHKRLTDEKNASIINGIFAEVTGGSIRVIVTVDENLSETQKTATNEPSPATSDTLESITQIFGGGEVLEQ